jgi:hypothetical protein
LGRARSCSRASWSGHDRARWYGPLPEPVCLKAVVLLTDPAAAEHEQKYREHGKFETGRIGEGDRGWESQLIRGADAP